MPPIPPNVLRTLLACVLTVWLTATGSALDAGKVPTQYVHDVWGVREGLPQDSVRAVCQTCDGYLWLGTLTGLARFDGVRFTVLEGLPDESVRDVCEDKHGGQGTQLVVSVPNPAVGKNALNGNAG